MRRGQTDLVAIAIEDLEWPPDRALATAAAAILPRHGYQPVILLGQSWRQFMLAGGADGVIVGVLPTSEEEDHAIAELARRGIAQVVISESVHAEQAVGAAAWTGSRATLLPRPRRLPPRGSASAEMPCSAVVRCSC